MGVKHFSGPVLIDGIPISPYQGLIPPARKSWFVDTEGVVGRHGDGTSLERPFASMSEALSASDTRDHIYWMGDVREELTASHLKFDVCVIAIGGAHHPDQPSSAYFTGASCWRPPTSPTTATPLLKLRGRGWKFFGGLFNCPVDAAGIKLERNALSGTSEYDPSHARFYGVRFLAGQNAIEDNGGCYNIGLYGCELAQFSAFAIKNSSTSVANPLNWKLYHNIFPANVSDFGNAGHIDSPLNCAILKHNIFGTVRSTGLYIDLTGGNGNVVCENDLGGVYDTSDYVPGTGDLWYQNRVAVKATTAPDGLSLTVPAAP